MRVLSAVKIFQGDTGMMNGKFALIGLMILTLSACATAKGAAVGAGIGALAGDAGQGARVGASVGLVVDIID
jgi:hypothetical protein